jgi:hypothetical protein
LATNAANEKGILMTLKEITHSVAEAYYILFLYAPEFLPTQVKTFAELKKEYNEFRNLDEKDCKKSLLKSDVQRAIRTLMKRIDGKRDIELLNKYYELAMGGDVQALKAYMDFKKRYFTDDESDELTAILKGASIDKSKDDDFEMDLS